MNHRTANRRDSAATSTGRAMVWLRVAADLLRRHHGAEDLELLHLGDRLRQHVELDLLGEVELVTYQGTDGADRYSRASPGRRGVTHLNWWVGDIETFSSHLSAHSVTYSSSYIRGRLIQTHATRTFRSPAGLQIEVHTAI